MCACGILADFSRLTRFSFQFWIAQLSTGVSDIRILRMYDSSKHVVWFGSASKMVIQSANTLTRCMVQGLVFAQNSTLSITLSGTENQVLIDSCTFTGSSGNRPLQIYSAGAIHLNNSIWSENKLTGGAEVRGESFSSFLSYSFFFFFLFSLLIPPFPFFHIVYTFIFPDPVIFFSIIL